jgi:hypothetical protein
MKILLPNTDDGVVVADVISCPFRAADEILFGEKILRGTMPPKKKIPALEKRG